MATGSGAFGVNGGFNQSAGGYFLVISTLANQIVLPTGGSGSGGSYNPGGFTATSGSTVPTAANVSTVFGVGKVIKDMGKTVVSAGRTFRKFQPVLNNTAENASSLGVSGNAASGAGAGYYTGYLELAREGSIAGASTGIPQIARFA